MAKPRLERDYAGDITEASRSVLAEMATALAAYRDSLVPIGGWAPYFLLDAFGDHASDFRHVGSIDIDGVIDPDRVDAERYATIVELLLARGYMPTAESLYQFDRAVRGPGGQEFLVRTGREGLIATVWFSQT
jgi:hypothetical protein